ncbi:hypothetical protein [Hyphomicrobium sp. CS1GBMeth3]|uniref:hypothetical protein n=1 Tax=Hyphomicrobium sp. CS1GBMeth3 TaxID=1892845 RepID=UPI000931EC31|nr:hypothetical protein [Hyphomicrobium sp. CS1GBMeth3]
MTRTPLLTRDQILKALGDADDATVAEIVGMGVTAEELGEAQAWIANDEPLFNTGKALPAGRVSRLTELLAKVDEDKALAAGTDEEAP